MTFRLVDAGWSAEFESALSIDHSELRIVCPFIKARALDRLLAFRPQNVRVITRYNLNDFARRVSDIAALRTLLDRGASVRGTLEADSFASTQENAARGRGAGNIDPRFAYRRQPAVRLSPQGCAWLSERLQAAFDQHGTMPRNKLQKLDWPDPPARPAPPRDA